MAQVVPAIQAIFGFLSMQSTVAQIARTILITIALGSLEVRGENGEVYEADGHIERRLADR